MIVRMIVLLALVHCGHVVTDAQDAQAPSNHPEAAEETVIIPLTEIWSTDQKWFGGMDIPKTRNIAALEEDLHGAGPLVSAIRRELDPQSRRPESRKKEAGPAFAVEGTGFDALRNAHAVLVEKQPRPIVVPKDSEISIVFFSLNAPYHVSLTEVKRQGNAVLVRYELIPHMEDAITDHFSLIPLGKLPPGHYQVAISRDPLRERYSKARIQEEFVRGRVSTPFEFDVK